MFRDKSMIESDFVQDWLDSKKELSPINVSSIEDHKQRKQVAREAKLRSKDAEKMTFVEKTKNVRQRRKEELEATTNIITSKVKSQDVDVPRSAEAKVVLLPKGRKRKIKGRES